MSLDVSILMKSGYLRYIVFGTEYYNGLHMENC